MKVRRAGSLYVYSASLLILSREARGSHLVASANRRACAQVFLDVNLSLAFASCKTWDCPPGIPRLYNGANCILPRIVPRTSGENSFKGLGAKPDDTQGNLGKRLVLL